MRPQLAGLTELPTFTTERLTLRPLRDSDVEPLFAVYSDPEAMRYWSTLPHADIEVTRTMLARIQACFEARTVLEWAIERNEDAAVLGTITLLTAPDQPRSEFGYILGHRHWGEGYAGEAQRKVLDFGFGELELHRIEADTDPANEASGRSLERLGFRREGRLRERWVVGGKHTDSLIWGLLAAEWTPGGP